MTFQHLQILKTPFQTYYIDFDLNLLLTPAFLLVQLRFRTSGMRKESNSPLITAYILSPFLTSVTHILIAYLQSGLPSIQTLVLLLYPCFIIYCTLLQTVLHKNH